MSKVSMWLAALAITATTASVVSFNHPSSSAKDEPTVSAAFRDGVYRGQLAAEHRETPRFATSRWASASDRQAFAAGYDQAYRSALAPALRDVSLLGELSAEEERNLKLANNRD